MRPAAIVSLVLFALFGLAGCGSGGHHSSRTAAKSMACHRVAIVLTNGPDPDADPVGYAQAQIVQLRALTAAAPAVKSAATRLASAYQAYSATNGTDLSAKSAASEAIKAINALCPAAGATL